MVIIEVLIVIYISEEDTLLQWFYSTHMNNIKKQENIYFISKFSGLVLRSSFLVQYFKKEVFSIL